MSFMGNDSTRRDPRQARNAADRSLTQEDAFQPETTNGLGSLRNVLGRNQYSDDATPSKAAGPIPPDKCENVLASGAKWEGKLTVDSSVRIDGVFSGEILSNSTVHVADGAQVNAKIQAAYVAIAGDFRGELHCEQRTDLLPHGRVRGDIVTKVLIVQEGAIFDGNVQMATSGTPRLTSRSEGMAAAEAPQAERRQNARPSPIPMASSNTDN
jgi:cytoskeletal protein CcmA (bactofilin family)